MSFIKEIEERLKNAIHPIEARPKLVLSSDSKKVIREWVIKYNPRLSEVSFLGVGQNNFIDKVYAPAGDFSPNSGLFLNGFSGSSHIDIEEQVSLFELARSEGRLNEVLLYGHLHPTGEIGDSFALYPSPGDIQAVRNWLVRNPHVPIPYEAIAARINGFPLLGIYPTSFLAQARNHREVMRNKVACQIVELD